MQKARIPSPDKLWRNIEERIIEVISIALTMLQQESSLPSKEDEINPKLCVKLRKANYDLWSKGRGLLSPPFCEAQNQPLTEEDINSPHINKKPDIQWGITNPSEEDYEKAYKFYAIECKRLGDPPSDSWILNENYVRKGVLRFIKKEFGYGKYTPSGTMVGYIQNMELNVILNEVNSYLQAESLAEIILPFSGWKKNGVSRLEQCLERNEVPPSPFDLRHLWVDLRNNYCSKNN